MGHQFSRSVLYDLVWSEPRTSLARRLGISDVGLAKACARAGIPMPPRGHWARLAAGRRTVHTPLPPRGLGQSDTVQLGARDYRPVTDQEAMTLPPAPVFDEPIVLLCAGAGALLEHCKVPRSLHHPHRHIAALLEEDAARRKALDTDRHAWPRPEFDTPSALRRVRLVNALFMVLAQAGCPATVSGKDLRSVAFRVGDTHITVKIQSSSREAARPNAKSATNAGRDRIRLTAEGWPAVHGVPNDWQDAPGLALEERILEIARDILVLGEMTYRSGALQQHAWRVERKNELEKQARERYDRQQREARERRAREEQEQRDWLLQQASRLQQADAIRALVQALDGRDNLATAAEAEIFRRWRQWALDEADRIDPRLASLSALAGPAFTRLAEPDRPESH